MIERLVSFYEAHVEFFGWLGGASVLMFVLSLVSLPWLVARIPEDYFLSPEPYVHYHEFRHPVIRFLILIIKNIFGMVLLLAGISMLVLPGQGILTIMMGLVLLNFPGKRRFERWLIRKQSILRALNWLRRRAGHAPLLEPE
jgi:hypothetical protein